MSRIKTGGMKKGYKYKKKRCWYNNGEFETLVFEDESAPEGYIKGRLKTGTCWNKGLTKYNNSSIAKMSENKKLNSDDYSGNRTDYLISKFENNNDFIEYWNTHTCKECVNNFNITWEDLHFIIKILNLESPKEHRKLMKDYIFDDNFKSKQSRILKGKNTWSKGRKRSDTSIENQKKVWKNKTKEQLIEYKQKEYLTRKNNGTLGFHKTKEEKELENLLISIFGEDDIEYNYFNKERYPFKCDFYVKSMDLFIELHAGWEHQSHPFDESSLEDKKLLEELIEKSKTSNYYSNVIYQWTELDVRKLNTFKENKLNYIIGYTVEEINEVIKDKINKTHTC